MVLGLKHWPMVIELEHRTLYLDHQEPDLLPLVLPLPLMGQLVLQQTLIPLLFTLPLLMDVLLMDAPVLYGMGQSSLVQSLVQQQSQVQRKLQRSPVQGFLSAPGRNVQKPSHYVQVQSPVVQLHQAKNQPDKLLFQLLLL